MILKLKSKGALLALLLVPFLFSMPLNAEENGKNAHGNPDQYPQYSETSNALSNIAYGIDLWHDVNLKGDEKKIRQFKSNLLELIKLDISSNRNEVIYFEESKFKSDKSFKEQSRFANVEEAKNSLKVKERLFLSLKKSEAFSSQYRLFNDYVDLLKKELKINKIELAEEIRHISADEN